MNDNFVLRPWWNTHFNQPPSWSNSHFSHLSCWHRWLNFRQVAFFPSYKPSSLHYARKLLPPSVFFRLQARATCTNSFVKFLNYFLCMYRNMQHWVKKKDENSKYAILVIEVEKFRWTGSVHTLISNQNTGPLLLGLASVFVFGVMLVVIRSLEIDNSLWLIYKDVVIRTNCLINCLNDWELLYFSALPFPHLLHATKICSLFIKQMPMSDQEKCIMEKKLIFRYSKLLSPDPTECPEMPFGTVANCFFEIPWCIRLPKLKDEQCTPPYNRR